MSRTRRANFYTRAPKRVGTGFCRARGSGHGLTNTSRKVILSDMGELRPELIEVFHGALAP